MKKRKPFIVGAGVGAAVLTSMGAGSAVAQQSATMGVSVTVQQVVTVTSRNMSVTALPIVASGTVQVSAPSAPTAVGSIGGDAIAGGTVAATVGAFAFTRNAPVTVTPGATTATMACRGTATTSPTLSVDIDLVTTSFATGGTTTNSCTTAALGVCGIFVLPELSFPANVGTGGCTNGTLVIPLTYATS